MISLAAALLRLAVAKNWAMPTTLGLTGAWLEIYQRCESPIERLMCVGIKDDLGYEADAGSYQGHPLPPDRRAGALVFGQQEIGPYRADFLIVARVLGEQPRLVVVECDGQHFHEPLRDHKRDLDMANWGYEVVRFTGNEIIRDLSRRIRRIPEAIGDRYAYLISAEYGRVDLPDVVDQLEVAKVIADDEVGDGFSNWEDTI